MAESNIDFKSILEEDSFIKIIGKNMRYYRLLAGLSQEELAERANISTSFYIKLETMQSKNPGIRTVARICCALNIPIDFLFRNTNLRIFETYSNTRMFQEMNKLSDDEFEVYAKGVAAQYEIFANRKKALSVPEE